MRNRASRVPEEQAADNTNALNVLGTAFSPDLKTDHFAGKR